MDLRTARQNMATAERDLKTARDRFNKLIASSARKRRPDPGLPQAKRDQTAAEAKLRDAVDDYNKAQQRPRYTAPR